MKNLTILFLIFFIASCGNQTAPPLNIEEPETPIVEEKQNDISIPETPEATFTSEETTVPEEPEPEVENSGPSPEPVVAPPLPVDTKDEVEVEPILFEDYAWEKYMIEPGDFLGKIAQKEYGDFRLWRYIYAWNKEEIGDNPNLIFPYNFFDLQKERLKAKTAEPTFFEYTVQPGDNLWNIANRQYGDPKSWIILLFDNESTIKSNSGILSPGMSIKLREKLDPNA